MDEQLLNLIKTAYYTECPLCATIPQLDKQLQLFTEKLQQSHPDDYKENHRAAVDYLMETHNSLYSLFEKMINHNYEDEYINRFDDYLDILHLWFFRISEHYDPEIQETLKQLNELFENRKNNG